MSQIQAERIIEPVAASDGAGVKLKRSIGTPEADYIDTKLERIQLKLSSGDWKSASKRLLEVVVEGALTQSIYDEYESEINNYINNHY